jgi:hypothetical protein
LPTWYVVLAVVATPACFRLIEKMPPSADIIFRAQALMSAEVIPRKSRRTPAFQGVRLSFNLVHNTGGWVSPGASDAACPCFGLGVFLCYLRETFRGIPCGTHNDPTLPEPTAVL